MESPVVKRVWEIAEPLVANEGMEIVDVEYHREPRGATLRLFLDRDGGVSLDDLAPFSRRVGDLLDAYDVVPGSYTLEVSSPGINRRLRTPEHFRRFIGRKVRIRTRAPIDGRRVFTGVLETVEPTGVTIGIDDGSCAVAFDAIARANYEHEFSAASPKAKSSKRGKRCNLS
jgi:ribosome maturation factor RimP